MGYGVADPKIGCNTCNVDVKACPGTSELPNPNQGMTGVSYNGFTNMNSEGQIIQQVSISQGQFRPSDYINLFMNKGNMPLFKKMVGAYKGISRLIFDYDQVLEDNLVKTGFDMNFKPLFKNFKDAPVLPSDDGYSFIYSERENAIDPYVYAYLDTDGTDDFVVIHDGNGNPVNLNSPKYRGLFEVQSTLYITSNGNNLATPEDPDCCAEMIMRTIVGIDSIDIGGVSYTRFRLETLETATGVAIRPVFKGYNITTATVPNTVIDSLNDENGGLYKGDRIMFAFKSRNQCEYVVGDANEFGDVMKRSYVQNTGRTISFYENELNISYADEAGAMSVITRRIGSVNLLMVKEIARAFYLGRNRAPNAGSSFVQPLSGQTVQVGPETMGLLTSIYEANIKYPKLNIITSMKDLRAGVDKAQLILEQLVNIQQSGVVSQGDEIILLMDRKAMSVYNNLNAEFNRLMGAQYTITENTRKSFDAPQIFTPYGTISLYVCEMFEQITNNTGNMLFVPKKLVMVTQPENSSFDLLTGQMKKNTLGFSVFDVTSPKEKPTGCHKYAITGKFAYIFGMVGSGAYRRITNVH